MAVSAASEAENAPVFSPDAAAVSASQLTAFMRFCEAQTGQRFADLSTFHEFSVQEYRRFWALFLSWSGLLSEGSPEPVCTDDRCERATFFPGLRLSYVENLLRSESEPEDERTALVAHHAARAPERLSRRELRDRVRSAAEGLAGLGLTAGERVAAVAGNNAEVVVGALATAALGATFSSAAPDMGTPALLSRFEQLAPVILFANLGAGGGAASTALADRVAELARGLPTLRAVVALDDGPIPPGLPAPVHRLSDISRRSSCDEVDETAARYGFNHPLFILFTSGTTGPPKCIVHGAGGTLLEHVKEHRLHVDLGPEDTLFFHTSTAWMMWNWQLSALASGSAIVVYDGPLTGPETLWRLVAEERVSVFGTSPPYLQLCEDGGFSPQREVALPNLRAVLSTGSILHDWQYDWIRDHVGPLPVQSISGGTDIVGCFVLGNPNLPVRRGHIQCRSLGLDVQALPTEAAPSGSRIGELVCRNAFPSRPLGLLGDDGRRFHEAYFQQNPGVWTHGDLIEFDDAGQARIQGRSDGVVHVRGIRIGPAEIYRALRNVPDVREAMAVEQQTSDVRGQPRLVLLVVLREPGTLDGRLPVRIRREIAQYASPAHVPELVVQVRELPTTHSGKRSERAAQDAVNGVPAGNTEALSNPRSLAEIRQAVALATEQLRELHGVAEPGQDVSTEARVRAIWESVLGVVPLQPNDNFFDVGGTSLAAVRVFQLVHDRLGVDLPLSTLLEAQTPAALAAVIDGPGEQRAPPLVLLRPGTSAQPLFVVHGLAGDLLHLRVLVQKLRTDRPVYGIRAVGLNPREQPQTRVEDMADTYIRTMQSVQPTGAYAIASYSFGGLAAFEMARKVTERTGEVSWLGLIDTYVDHRCLPWRLRWRFRVVRPFRYVRAALAEPRTRLPRYLRTAVLRVAPRAPIAPPTPEWPLPPRQVRVADAGWKAFHAYRPGPYAGTATFFHAEVREPGLCDPLPVWQRAVQGGLTVEYIPGPHLDAMEEPTVSLIAERLSAHLEALGA